MDYSGRQVVDSHNVKRKRSCRDHHDLHTDWSQIDCDSLECILKKLVLSDILSCRAVCRSWRSLTKTYLSSSLISPFNGPLPLFVYYYSPYRGSIGRYFLDHVTSEGQSFYMISRIHSEKLLKKVSDCVGYSQNWFLFLDNPEVIRNNRKRRRLCLFHPWLFSTSPVCFPLIPVPPESYHGKGIQKAALLGDPIFSSSSSVAVMVIIHGLYKKFLFAKCGDAKFTPLPNQSHHHKPSIVERDIICFNNCIYGFTFTDEGRHHRLEAWSCGQHLPGKVLDFEIKFNNSYSSDSDYEDYKTLSSFHLVELEGELLLVSLQLFELVGLKRPKYHKWGFRGEPDTCRVYKMDFTEKKWVQIDSLGDWIIFVMDYQTMCLPSHKFPQYEKNSIYFKRDLVGRPKHLKVFDMTTRKGSYLKIKGESFY